VSTRRIINQSAKDIRGAAFLIRLDRARGGSTTLGPEEREIFGCPKLVPSGGMLFYPSRRGMGL